MSHTRSLPHRLRRSLPLAVSLLLAGMIFAPSREARAGLPSPLELHRSIREGVHDVFRALGSVPEEIARAHERHLRIFLDGRSYDRGHHHYHEVYRFPVWADGHVAYRPYTYCNGRLVGPHSTRPRLWVDWSNDRGGVWCDRCHSYYPRGHRHDDHGRYDGRDRYDRHDHDRYDRHDRHDRYDGSHDRYDGWRDRDRRHDGYRHDDRRYGHAIPPGHLPPPGSCRVWYEGRPPGHQPPPTDCASAERAARHHGGRVIYGGRRH